MIYLASPYTHEDPAVMQERFCAVELLVIHMLKQNIVVFSPIVYCHEMAVKADFPRDAGFWQGLNATFLRMSSRLVVLRLPGWDTSRGVQWEISMAEALQIPIDHLEAHCANN